jgi:hypothetical protein
MLGPLNSKHWPRDTQKYIFLPRAFDDIGRAKYGEDWDRLFKSKAFGEAMRLMRERYGEAWDRCDG